MNPNRPELLLTEGNKENESYESFWNRRGELCEPGVAELRPLQGSPSAGSRILCFLRYLRNRFLSFVFIRVH
jgi:hypothetical protein